MCFMRLLFQKTRFHQKQDFFRFGHPSLGTEWDKGSGNSTLDFGDN